MDEIFNGTASCFSSEVVGRSGKIVSAIVCLNLSLLLNKRP